MKRSLVCLVMQMEGSTDDRGVSGRERSSDNRCRQFLTSGREKGQGRWKDDCFVFIH